MNPLRRLAATAAALLLVPTSAMAQDAAVILQARAAGLVGERFDGYLGLVGAAPEPIRRQVGAVNILRRSLYTQLAQRKGVGREDVGLTAACTLLGRVAPGEYYQLPDRQWRRRGAGEGPPRPDYCA